MTRLNSIFLTIIVLFSLFLITACPSPPTIEKAKSASAKLAGIADTGVNLTRTLYRRDVISLEQKDRVADAFIKLAKSGVFFDKTVRELENIYTDSHPPRDKLSELIVLFNSGIVADFITLLTTLRVISADGKFVRTIELMKTSILLIASVLQIEKNTKAKIAEVG